jgi:hypothetical protein
MKMITALGNMVFMSLDGNRFDFQRINDKIKEVSSGCQGVELHLE